MATREVILRPGDKLSLLLDLPGRAMRLELALTEEGMALGAPTQRPGPARAHDVESLSAVEPYHVVEEHHDEHPEINLDLDDLEEEEVAVGHDQPPTHHAEPAYEVEEESGIPDDEIVMLPPTDEYMAPDAQMGSLDLDVDAFGKPKERFAPNPDDTLPVWTEKASVYKDPELEEKKHATGPGGNTNSPATAGTFTVFLSPPKGDDKKQAAARIIADLQGIDLGAAIALAGKMIVPVAKEVTESEANSIRDRFKEAGLNCRITQKR
jgi:hypothetical protein